MITGRNAPGGSCSGDVRSNDTCKAKGTPTEGFRIWQNPRVSYMCNTVHEEVGYIRRSYKTIRWLAEGCHEELYLSEVIEVKEKSPGGKRGFLFMGLLILILLAMVFGFARDLAELFVQPFFIRYVDLEATHLFFQFQVAVVHQFG